MFGQAMKCVILFESIHQVMKAEKILKNEGIEMDLIPVPREISSDCGVAIEIPLELQKEALRHLEGSHLSNLEYYIKKQNGKFKKWGKNG